MASPISLSAAAIRAASSSNIFELFTCLYQNRVGTRLLFAGNLTPQPCMIGANYRMSGELTNTGNVMNNVFWIGVQAVLSREM